MRLEQRPADDLGRVRGEHELDPQGSNGVPKRGGRQALGTQARKRLGTGAGLWLTRWIACISAPPADAMVLFSDIGQRQKLRERARDRDGRRQRQRAQPGGQLFEDGRVAPVRALRERAHLLDEREQRVAVEGAQRVAEQLAERPDVVAQRLVRVTDRGRAIGRTRRAGRLRTLHHRLLAQELWHGGRPNGCDSHHVEAGTRRRSDNCVGPTTGRPGQ